MAESEVNSYACFIPAHVSHDSGHSKKSSLPSKGVKMADKSKGKKGNPFKRGNTWTYILYVPDPSTGKKKQKWVGGFKTKTEASKALREAQYKIDMKSMSTWGDLIFEEYAKRYMEWKEPLVRPSTYLKYEQIVRDMLKSVLNLKMSDITVDDLNQLEDELVQKGYSSYTRGSVHTFLSSIFNWAVNNEDIPRNPYKRFRKPKVQKRETTTPTIEEVKVLLENTGNKQRFTGLYLPILLAVTLGLRVGEIVGLKYSDFDIEKKTVSITRQISSAKENGNRIITVTPPKTQSSIRVIAVPDTTLKAVMDSKGERNDDEWLFQKRNGDYLAREYLSTLYAEYRNALMSVGLLHTKVRFHDLRHAFAVINLDRGVPLKTISDALGHNSISITADIYCDRPMPSRKTAIEMESMINEITQSAQEGEVLSKSLASEPACE